jgi:hypothetical protein
MATANRTRRKVQKRKRMMRAIVCLFLLALIGFPRTASADLLEQGFKDMYNLSFASAHDKFASWEKSNPDSPEGPVFDAAASLFSEFDRLKILQSEFFVNDHVYEDRKRETPSPEIRQRFETSLSESKRLSEQRLQQNPNDESALFANVLRLGLHANYLALIEKQNLSALSEIKQATESAEGLLRLHPTCYDAYIAIGVENYLLSLKPAPVRWLLHATGAQTDKQMGIEKLKLTATEGHYLQPYAELLLAVAALRDKDSSEARRLLSSLATRFPRNPLYREELDRIR